MPAWSCMVGAYIQVMSGDLDYPFQAIHDIVWDYFDSLRLFPVAPRMGSVATELELNMYLQEKDCQMKLPSS